jgi:hypothetical protein
VVLLFSCKLRLSLSKHNSLLLHYNLLTVLDDYTTVVAVNATAVEAISRSVSIVVEGNVGDISSVIAEEVTLSKFKSAIVVGKLALQRDKTTLCNS